MISFEGINEGDKVKLERENGDTTIFTVKDADYYTLEDCHYNGYYNSEWDKLTILERKEEPIKDGLYSEETSTQKVVGYYAVKDGEVFYTSLRGAWINGVEEVFLEVRRGGLLNLEIDWSE